MSDYANMLAEYDITEEVMSNISNRQAPVLSVHPTTVQVKESRIHGKGMFSTVVIIDNSVIMPMSLNGIRTIAGKYTNHSNSPNCVPVLQTDGNVQMRAIRTIANGEELTVDYRKAIAIQRKSDIMILESRMLELPEALDFDEATAKFVEHFFAPGTYSRLMTIPADTCIVGKIHKFAHTTVLLAGTVLVKSEFMSEELTAPYIFTSDAETKRAMYAITDCQWLTIHPNVTNTKDLDILESELIMPMYNFEQEICS